MLLQHAIQYVNMGWYVLPLHYPVFVRKEPPRCSCKNPNCSNIGKHPALKNGVKGASNDPQVIQRWWSKGNWNIGIAAGASGIIIIDVDPRNGGLETLDSICTYYPIPRTLTARTGGGGKHYIFTESSKKLPKTIGAGIDVQQGNKYIVAPPSLHASGNHYQWLNTTPPVQPDWIDTVVENIIEKPKIPQPTEDDAQIPTEQKRAFAEGCLIDAAEKIKRAKPGERQTMLNKEAYGMGGFVARNLLDEEEVISTLLRAAPISVGVYGIEDFTLEEAKRTIVKGIQDGKEAPRSLGYLQPAVTHDALPSPDGSVIEWRETQWPPDLMDPGGDWTELGLARRSLQVLTQKYKSDVICDRDRLWSYSLEEHRWREIPPHHQTIATIWHGSIRGKKKKPLNVTAAKLNAIQKLMNIESHQPGFFDKSPQGVCFANGRYVDGKLIPLTSDDRNMFVIPHSYDPEADTTEWDKWFSYFWPDKNIRSIILEFLGASLFGVVTKFERALMLLGGGDNGKSTLLNLIRALFHPQAVISINPHYFNNEYYRARLTKAQLNIVTELRYEELKDTETIKAIISGEEISAREPAGKVFFFEPQMGNIFAGNKLPSVGDFTHGFRKRFLLIPCSITIPKEKIIPSYHNFLMTHALPGFIRRLVENAETLIERGRYTESKRVEAAKADWFEDSNQVISFVNEAISQSSDNGDLYTTTQQVYNHYRVWATATGHKPLSKRNLTKRLRELKVPEGRTKDSRGFLVSLIRAENF